MQHNACYLLLSLFYIIFSVSITNSAADTIIYVQCTQLNFTSSTPYELNLNSLFTSLVESGSVCNFNRFKISPPGNLPNDVVYGLFQCRGDLSFSDCRDCVANSVTPLKTTCPLSVGGTIQSEGCLVKYDNTSFFGFEDKTEVFKRCGPSIGYNSEDVLNSRDDALAYLNTLNGQYFRVGGSGSVQGVAQCVQDLSVTDCQDCLAEASERLRSECETSSWGDMYLGKCHIRYADHGIDNDHTDNGNRSSTDNNDTHGGSSDHMSNILKVFGIILAAFLSTGSLSYCFSVTITKHVVKMNAQIKNNITLTNQIDQVKKELDGTKEEVKEVKKVAEKANDMKPCGYGQPPQPPNGYSQPPQQPYGYSQPPQPPYAHYQPMQQPYGYPTYTG